MATIEQAFDLSDAVPPKCDIKLTLTVSIAPEVQKLLDQLKIPNPRESTSPVNPRAKLKIKKLHPDAILPAYATDGAACFDISVHGQDWGVNAKAYGVEINTHRAATFDTGLAFEVPAGYVMLVFSRSGHGFKNGARLSNCVGVIDSDYRGELKVRIQVDGPSSMVVNMGDRIAQAMLVPIPQVEFELVDELGDTARGANGLGSTGK